MKEFFQAQNRRASPGRDGIQGTATRGKRGKTPGPDSTQSCVGTDRSQTACFTLIIIDFLSLTIFIPRSTQSIGPSPFQKMRALDKRIQEQEQAIKTLQKEQAGVKVGFNFYRSSCWLLCRKAMVDTYKNNPSFADAKTKAKVNGEYETVSQKVRKFIIV